MATLNELMEGKKPGEIKVQLKSFLPEQYFVPHFQSICTLWHGINESGDYERYDEDLRDWQLYTEPKPKVKRAQYIVISDFYGLPHRTTGFFKDDDEARENCPGTKKKVERLPETEREFDE